ncbi:hypothetical protein [Emticicia sp. SJ17W-69]|uniref:hypothetical protein n=1 Tax=Emticicia sp. SJ17W-69 TaxID=3421657 RepID=UPI003EC14FCC
MSLTNFKTRKYIQEQQKLFHGGAINEEIFVSRCFDFSCESIISYFKEIYLYHTVLFISDYKKVRTIDINNIDEFLKKHSNNDEKRISKMDKVRKSIEGAATLVKEDKAVSITEFILESNDVMGLVLKGNGNAEALHHYSDSFAVYNLLLESSNSENSKFIEKINTYFEGNEAKINEMMNYYSDFVRNYDNDFFAYFLRPETNGTYNGILFFIVERALEEDELCNLFALIEKILSQTALIKVKDAEWKKINDEQSHSFVHQLNALVSYNKKGLEFLEENNQYKGSYLETNLLKSESALSWLKQANEFNLAIMRVGEMYLDTGKIDERGAIFLENDTKTFCLLELITESIEVIKNSIESLSLSQKEHKETILQLIESLPSSNEIVVRKDYEVTGLNTGVRLVILELLKNTFKYTNYKNPKIKIQLVESSGYDYLIFENNKFMTKEAFDFWVHDIETESFSTKITAGIRTIKRYLSLPYFVGWNKRNYEPKQFWRLEVDAESKNTENNVTKISLKIPKP